MERESGRERTRNRLRFWLVTSWIQCLLTDPALLTSTGIGLHDIGRINTDVEAEDQGDTPGLHLSEIHSGNSALQNKLATTSQSLTRGATGIATVAATTTRVVQPSMPFTAH